MQSLVELHLFDQITKRFLMKITVFRKFEKLILKFLRLFQFGKLK